MKKILSLILEMLMFAYLPMAFSAEGEDTSDSKTKREIVCLLYTSCYCGYNCFIFDIFKF